MRSEQIWIEWGAWYASRRKAAGLSQQKVADITGMERTHISDLETGKSGARRDTIIALAEAIHVDAEEALDKAGFKTPARTGVTFEDQEMGVSTPFESEDPEQLLEQMRALRDEYLRRDEELRQRLAEAQKK